MKLIRSIRTTFCGLLVLIFGGLLVSVRSQLVKRGECPVMEKVPECPTVVLNDCIVDLDCEGKIDKCCFDGCKLRCVPAINIEEPKRSCQTPVDLGFVVDSSGSIGETNFVKIRDFVKAVVNEFSVSEKGTHVSVISYSDTAEMVFNFDTLKGNEISNDAVGVLVDAIPFLQQQTRIDLGLLRSGQEMFNVNYGMRKSVPKVLFVMTDGQQTVTDDSISVLEASQAVKSKGVQVYSLGIGPDVNVEELLDIASDEFNVFKAESFDELIEIVREFTEASCKACNVPADIAFAIPANRYMTEEDFNSMKSYIAQSLKFLKVGRKAVHIGLMLYAENSEVVLKFDETYRVEDIKGFIDRLPFQRGENRVDRLLEAAKTDMFTLRGGVRQGAVKSLVLLTNQRTDPGSKNLDQAAQPLRELGINVVGVTIGSNADVEAIRQVTTYPDGKHLFESGDFFELESLAPYTSGAACQGRSGKCPLTERPAQCPPETSNECDVDNDCDGNQKCCNDGCNYLCTGPRLACSTPLDLAFVVDGSNLVSSRDYQNMKDFMKAVANSQAVNEGATHMAAVQFDNNAKTMFPLSMSTSVARITQSIDIMSQSRGGGRDLGKALKHAKDSIFTIEGGMRQWPPKFIILITTSSQGTDALSEIASELEAYDVQVISVGVGSNVYESDLEKISKNRNNIIMVDSFGRLPGALRKVNRALCDNKDSVCEFVNPEEFCLITEDECDKDYDCPGISKCCHDGCRKVCIPVDPFCDNRLDVAFVVQATDSKTFSKAKDFLKDMVVSFRLNPGEAHIGLMSYGSTARIDLDFNAGQGQRQVLEAIDRMSFVGGTPKANVAMKTALDDLFGDNRGSRKEGQRAVVLINDGQLPGGTLDGTIDAAWQLKLKGVDVFSVPVGEPDVAALKRIVSEPQDRNIFLTENPKYLIENIRQLNLRACQGAIKPTPTYPVIVGPPGPPGPPGDPGPRGPTGGPGPRGGPGLPGDAGTPGTPGRPGGPGLPGPPGPPGPAGVGQLITNQGQKGPGNGGGGGIGGFVGSLVGSIFGGGGSNQGQKGPDWGAAGGLQAGQVGGGGGGSQEKGPLPPVAAPIEMPGAPGVAGPPGYRGPDGVAGPTGRRGPSGERGPRGPPGLPGLQGSLGVQGNAGDTGKPGTPGQRGDAGPRGAIGDIGFKGQPGIQGSVGHKGQKGVAGQDGMSGDKGRNGARGKRGENGRNGEKGYIGEMGRPGVAGVPGPAGLTGIIGEVGMAGERGLTGYSGLPGPMGSKGPKGTAGIPGQQGIIGERGSHGISGPKGRRGKEGTRGRDGGPGMKGSRGDPGNRGGPGATGKQGPQGPPGVEGQPGREGGRGDPGVPGGSGEPGVKGIMGEMGDEGMRGRRGPTGPRGKPGEQGPPGGNGGPGDKGPPGGRGETGIDGPNGLKGSVGDLGPTGSVGLQGPEGSPGSPGLPGPPGPRGNSGEVGRPGRKGKPGLPGPSGDDGGPGETGPQGPPGIIGHRGIQGAKGIAGLPGRDGDRGGPGVPGTKGEEGAPGTRGQQGTNGLDGGIGERGIGGIPGGPGLQGIEGKRGQPGLPGKSGEQGPVGDTGPVGKDGGQGPQGSIGDPGPPGETGVQGVRGGPGTEGKDGIPGNQGGIGPAGRDGLPGGPGAPGLPGVMGAPGKKGEQGRSGDKGPPGVSGKDGEPGPGGPMGPMGEAGSNGEKGSQGARGIQGPVGGRGITGVRGSPGGPGSKGYPGNSGQPGAGGPKGFPGGNGAKGEQGQAGRPGEQGVAGKEGGPGEQGEKGSIGEEGVQGGTGRQGRKGERGPPGARGASGEAGEMGNSGKDGGKGEAGEKGVNGPPGRSGRRGPPGRDGIDGDPGPDGKRGIKGSRGASGIPGSRGPPGDPGLPGGRGGTGLPGSKGEGGSSGNNGKDGEPGDVGTDGIKGQPGKQGPPGARGPPGPVGDGGGPGIIGPKGDIGDPGVTGGAGSIGIPGPQGGAGPKGEVGIKGVKGSSGNNGIPGLPGAPGKPGRDGVKGPIGDIGPKGERGDPGRQGGLGLLGRRGDLGAPGESGEPGLPGPPGPKGPNGAAGPRGPPGQAGPDGNEGARGPKGPIGDSGRKGRGGLAGPPGPPGPPGLPGRAAAQPIFSAGSIKGPPGNSYYRSHDLGNSDDSENDYSDIELKDAELFSALNILKEEVENYKRPDGTREHPAKTCKDLSACHVQHKEHEQLKNGHYWIDPNEGAPDDAVLVFCDFHMAASCIYPTQSKSAKEQWLFDGDEYKWFGDELPKGYRFTYDVESIQLTFLRLLSDEAWQNITYHCLNSVAWEDGSTGDNSKSIKLRGDNNLEFHALSPRRFRPTVILDQCKIKDNKWHQTILEMRTDRTQRLPFRDLAAFDIGDSGEEFGLEIGPVCFS